MKKIMIFLILFSIKGFSQHLPVAVNDTFNVPAGVSSFKINVTANDYDLDGDAIRINSIMIQPKHGTATKLNDSIISYSPIIYYTGPDSIAYIISEVLNVNNSDTAWIILTDNQMVGVDFIDTNNIRALIWPNNNLFWNHIGKALYEYPKGSGKNTIFTSTLWIGGNDSATGNLHLAGERFLSSGDFWTGPLSINGTAFTDSATSQLWNRTWKINKCTIDSFQLWYANHSIYSNYTVPSIITNWPGNGGTGQSAIIAPYFDNNHDGHYNCSDGDYPLIRGDQAIFYIFNDSKTHTETSGLPLGVEIRAMVYAFKVPGPLDNTVYIDYSIINRSTNTYDSTYIGIFTDLDIGLATDDYIGCNVEKSSYYGYNGAASDGDGTGNTYGANPPAQAVCILKGPLMTSDNLDNPAGVNEGISGTFFGDGIADNERLGLGYFTYFNNATGPMGDPTIDSRYYNYMKGIWADGSRFTFGGVGHSSSTFPTRFVYPGSSDTTTWWGTGGVRPTGATGNWSEASVGNNPGDRRGMGSSGPFKLRPGENVDITVAYITARGSSGNLSSVDTLMSYIDSIRHTHIPGLGISNNKTNGFSLNLYPNPAKDQINIKAGISKPVNMIEISLYDCYGRKISTENISGSKAGFLYRSIDVSELSNGLYFLQFRADDNNVLSRKIIIQK